MEGEKSVLRVLMAMKLQPKNKAVILMYVFEGI